MPMKKPTKKPNAVKIDPTLLERLLERKLQTGSTVVWMVNEAIRQYFSQIEKAA